MSGDSVGGKAGGRACETHTHGLSTGLETLICTEREKERLLALTWGSWEGSLCPSNSIPRTLPVTARGALLFPMAVCALSKIEGLEIEKWEGMDLAACG